MINFLIHTLARLVSSERIFALAVATLLRKGDAVDHLSVIRNLPLDMKKLPAPDDLLEIAELTERYVATVSRLLRGES